MDWAGTRDYARILLGFTRATGGGDGAALAASKYVDLNAFLRLVFGGPAPVARFLILFALAAPLAYLAAAWWRLGGGGGVGRRVLWAATLTWTLVANLYVGVYDSILVVPAALLTADALYRPGDGVPRFRGGALPALLLLVYATPWFSQHLARVAGLQVYTLALLAFAAYQLVVAREIIAAADPEDDGHGSAAPTCDPPRAATKSEERDGQPLSSPFMQSAPPPTYGSLISY